MKKYLTLGLSTGVVMLIISYLAMQIDSSLFPQLKAEYANPALFRPWDDPLMSLIFIYPFIVGFILSWFWDKTNGLIKEKIWWKKGFNFGLAYWVLTVPGMLISYSSFPLSLLMILSWTWSGLLQAIAAGIVFAKLEK